MTSQKLIKWAITAAAAMGLISVAVPVLADLPASTQLIESTTPVKTTSLSPLAGQAQAPRLKTHHTRSHTRKLISRHAKHLSKHHTRKASLTSSHKHRSSKLSRKSKLDKAASSRSIM